MFNRTPDSPTTDLPQGGKIPLKPAHYDPPGNPARGTAGIGTRQPAGLAPSSPHDVPKAPSAPAPYESAPRPSVAARHHEASDDHADSGPGSRLHVGVNIKLKGVEISDCDVLVIEGHVEATVNSKAMQIDRPGTLKGTALIDVAEVHGDFTGELTARTRLVVHGTGRVSGSIRYGKLVVEEGGEVSGDVKRLDANSAAPHSARPPAADRHGHAPVPSA
jgi:cytoskeletal protein CcmA (bactofilin family)